MKRLLKYLQGTTLDQKRYLAVALLAGGLLLVYALSRVGEKVAPIVEQSKPNDFKNGSLTSDETSAFYRKKDDLVRRQNEKILEDQKRLDEKLSELSKKLDDAKTVQSTSPPQPVPGGLAGKKWIRRGQNQSKTSYLSDLRARV